MKYLPLLFLFSVTTLLSQVPSNAQSVLKTGKASQIIALCQQELTKNPNHLETIELLGDAYAAQGDWQQALEQFGKLKAIKPRTANYEFKYGGALGMIAKNSNKFKALGMVSDIRKSFENAIKIDPNHIDARWALIELNLQLPIIAGGSESEAKQYASQLLKISPVDGYLAQGHIAEYYERYKAAELNYKAAITVGKSKTAYQKLADLYKNKMQQPQKATAIMAEYDRTQSL